MSSKTHNPSRTSTNYLYDVEAKKVKRALLKNKKNKRVLKPARPSGMVTILILKNRIFNSDVFIELAAVADNIISSACSCLATATPTVTSTVYESATSTVDVSSIVLSTAISTASIVTETQISYVQETSVINSTVRIVPSSSMLWY
jgi:hypothetical protein